MSSENDWRSNVSSLDRYENIQKIKATIEASDPTNTSAQKEAFSKENEAYKNSASLDDYNAICRAPPSNQPPPPASPPFCPGLNDQEEDGGAASPGIAIGPYSNCHHVSGGVTAEVYRAQARALKVITETRNIAPHDPFREAKILAALSSSGSSNSIIALLETFRDQEQRFVLVFPYMPLTLESLLARGQPIARAQTRRYFGDLFGALRHLHAQGIIHRDVKPSAVLLASPDGPAYLSDFGTAWHPALSVVSEPPDGKILDIGTGPYRAPEVLFGDKAYGAPVDLWAAGAMLAECCRDPPGRRPLFESRAAHEDGNQLGLILSIFKTMGSPTPASWPEAVHFKTPPFEMYRPFEAHEWPEILPDVEPPFRDLVSALVKYESSSRASASDALEFLTTKCS